MWLRAQAWAAVPPFPGNLLSYDRTVCSLETPTPADGQTVSCCTHSRTPHAAVTITLPEEFWHGLSGGQTPGAGCTLYRAPDTSSTLPCMHPGNKRKSLFLFPCAVHKLGTAQPNHTVLQPQTHANSNSLMSCTHPHWAGVAPLRHHHHPCALAVFKKPRSNRKPAG